MDQVQHAISRAGAQVEDLASAVLHQVVAGRHMAARQVHHVDVVAHTRAVVRGIIVAEHAQLFELAAGDLGDVGHEVVGNAHGLSLIHI